MNTSKGISMHRDDKVKGKRKKDAGNKTERKRELASERF